MLHLLGDNLSESVIRKAELALYKFVCEFKDLYGEESITFNVHLLTHLAESVRNWGPLWDTAAFNFENENGKLLKLYNGAQHVHKQMVKKFFGLKVMNEFVDDCVRNASPGVAKLLKTINWR